MDHKIKLLADATLHNVALAFPAPFSLSFYDNNTPLQEQLQSNDILVCRSTLKVDEGLLKGSSIKLIASASSGVDHIDKTYLKTQNIPLFDAKGANADAVADYILANIAYLQLTHNIQGKKVGIIGMGAIGSLIANRLQLLGFDITPFDPWLDAYHKNPFESLYACDYISLHANVHEMQPYPSKKLLNKAFFKKLSPQTVIINAARGALIDEEALLEAEQPFIYCTDVYNHEPQINPKMVARATIATTHIAGHSIEAKQRAIFYLSQQIHKAYGLKEPSFPSLNQGSPTYSVNQNNWQKKILQHYNPSIETKYLKAALNKQDAFMQLRKAHLRHEWQLIIDGPQ